MVSRRNFFTMALTMLILFFMFQFTGMAKNALNEYDRNEYGEKFPVQYGAGDMYRADRKGMESELGPRPYILFVGDKDSGEIRHTVTWWCTYTKRGIEECSDLSEYSMPAGRLPQAAVIDGKSLDLQQSLPVLQKLAGAGVHLIFARLPERNALAGNQKFRELLGIEEVRPEDAQISGLHLFEGFLLGKERLYEEKRGEEDKMDLELKIPWYVTGTGTKTYIMGMVDSGEKYKNEVLPAIIWRNSVDGAKVFCVNADYISHMYGIGFLSAMMADADLYEIYPVVNAQNLSILNFAGYADENEQVMNRFYSESQTAVYRELVWPTLVSLTYKNGSPMTLLTTPQHDYSDDAEPLAENLVYYMKLLKEQHGEMGFSAESVSGTAPEDKCSRDQLLFQEVAENYDMLCLYAADTAKAGQLLRQPLLSKVRTVTMMPEGEEPFLDYLDRNRTLQYVTALAERHTYTDDLALMGLETALGYSNIGLDLQNVAYPPSEEYYWENLARSISGNIVTYWKDYGSFDDTTLTESDMRVRRFLALDFRAWQRGDEIVVKRTDTDGPVWFLLKLNGMAVKKVKGGTYEKLSGDYYLIELDEQEAVIELKDRWSIIHD